VPSSDPVVVSSTCQEWRGERFYLCGRYYQRKGRRLHRLVYAEAHGPIPKGHHVHHRNEDRADNRLANLDLMEGRAHVAQHSRNPTPAQSAARARNARTFASPANAKLTREQRSEAGFRARATVLGRVALPR
jgi:hypothetical protein